MCMVFLIYYPRMKGLRTCLSGLTPDTVMKLSGVEMVEKYDNLSIIQVLNIKNLSLFRLDENDLNPLVIKPSGSNQLLSQYVLEKKDWNIRETFTDSHLTYLLRYAPQKAQCFWRKLEGVEGLQGMEEIEQLITYPPLLQSYVKPRLKCRNLTTTTTNQQMTTKISSAQMINVIESITNVDDKSQLKTNSPQPSQTFSLNNHHSHFQNQQNFHFYYGLFLIIFFLIFQI